ncbi:hypothetical protein PSU4_45250 [Pseudonocardia sulfidoxydans NBRC 16205]|uniref:Big-1 domain-containing protein n=1 Tax=Pseudonocardia sulfidoxydans NBRC 16205 TaxID=1223511 RepID=A0A511DL82_9PSEU|nr:DUF11 domain-containing protein [Pseudonocardia sulfidoxydans]GEL25571.1 hypothetical protein PSU4_45250 [Pseudonocardia sulfidoxydans NBRC 16205]
MRHRTPTAPSPDGLSRRRHNRLRRTGFLAGLTAAALVAGMATVTGTAAAATPTRVSDADIAASCGVAGKFCHEGDARVVDDPGANEGNGYLRLNTPNGEKAYVFNRDFYGKPLSSLTDLTYETYIEQPGTANAQQAPSFNIEVTTAQGFTTLVWEPVYSGTPVTTGQWQTWSVSTAKGWWASKDVTSTDTLNKYGFTTYTATFADVKAALGTATIGQIGINQGSGAPGLRARVDRFGLNGTIYDFDNPVVPTTIVATAGDGQTAQTGKPFATALATKVTGAGNLAAPDRTVTYTVTSGSASFPGGKTATATTGADGVATAPTLTAGTDAGPVTVTATTGTLAPVTFTETVAAPPATGRNRADIAVTLTVPTTVTRNGTVQAVVTVRNNGPFDAAGVTAALTMPDALTVVAAPGGIAPPKGHNVAYLIPSITASTQVVYTVTLKADARTTGPQTLRAAAIPTRVPDPNLLDNAAVSTVTIKK